MANLRPDTAPATLNTLNELAAAIGDDDDYAAAVTTALGGKLALAGGTMSGSLNTVGITNTTGASDMATFVTTAGNRELILKSTAGTGNNTIAGIRWQALDSGNNNTTWAGIAGTVTDNSNTQEDGALVFQTSSGGTFAERMRIQEGNVGIGTNSPGSVDTGVQADADRTWLSMNQATTECMFTINRASAVANNDVMGKILFSADADSANHKFKCGIQGVVSGSTANEEGGAISFLTKGDSSGGFPSEKMRIDHNGIVGVGTWTPTRTHDKMVIYKASQDPTNYAVDNSLPSHLALFSTDSYAADKGATLALGGNLTSGYDMPFAFISGRKENSTNDNRAGYFTIHTTKQASPYTTEAMRITSAGNVGIGITAPTAKLHIVGHTTMKGFISFFANSDDAFSGYVGDGVNMGGGSTTDLVMRAAAACLFRYNNATTGAKLHTNGDWYTNDGTVSSLSDVRIKKDIEDLSDGLDLVNQLKPRTYRYNGLGTMGPEEGDPESVIRYGFVADEVLAVASQYVNLQDGTIDGEEVEDLKSVSTTRFIPMLVKAIQELSVKVTALENV